MAAPARASASKLCNQPRDPPPPPLVLGRVDPLRLTTIRSSEVETDGTSGTGAEADVGGGGATANERQGESKLTAVTAIVTRALWLSAGFIAAAPGSS